MQFNLLPPLSLCHSLITPSLSGGCSPSLTRTVAVPPPAQLLSIVEGVRQLSLLLKESWNTGSRAARAFSSQMKPADMARALQE